ncbi:MAG: glycosyltransferase family 2 protein, partial [Peptococcaceae bacterium]|nr:glycosyltransferase family 2 protein [Peptococcaceae bacterium]
MKCLKPLVTVAIPTRNRANYLREAIRSALSQTYTALEVIVSDNASADNTQEVVNGFSDPRIRYFRHETGLEMVSNWNYCLEQATGEFFLLLSDDDALESDAITWFVEQFADP